MTRDALGEFEQLVLPAIVRLGEGVDGVPVASTMGNPTPERGGKARRCVRITADGLESLQSSRQALDSMWRGIDLRLRGRR